MTYDPAADTMAYQAMTTEGLIAHWAEEYQNMVRQQRWWHFFYVLTIALLIGLVSFTLTALAMSRIEYAKSRGECNNLQLRVKMLESHDKEQMSKDPSDTRKPEPTKARPSTNSSPKHRRI